MEGLGKLYSTSTWGVYLLRCAYAIMNSNPNEIIDWNYEEGMCIAFGNAENKLGGEVGRAERFKAGKGKENDSKVECASYTINSPKPELKRFPKMFGCLIRARLRFATSNTFRKQFYGYLLPNGYIERVSRGICKITDKKRNS